MKPNQMTFRFSGQLEPMVWQREDPTLAAKPQPQEIWEAVRDCYRKHKSLNEISMGIQDKQFVLAHNKVCRSNLPDQMLGKTSAKFWGDLSKAVRKTRLNDPPKKHKRKVRYAPEVSISVFVEDKGIRIEAGPTTFNLPRIDHVARYIR